MSPAPHVDESELEELILLLKKPRTVKELIAHLGISRSTLYRHFGRLNQRGYRVERRGISRPAYYVLGVKD